MDDNVSELVHPKPDVQVKVEGIIGTGLKYPTIQKEVHDSIEVHQNLTFALESIK